MPTGADCFSVKVKVIGQRSRRVAIAFGSSQLDTCQSYIRCQGGILTSGQKAEISGLVRKSEIKLSRITRGVCFARTTVAISSGIIEVISRSDMIFTCNTYTFILWWKSKIISACARVAHFAAVGIVSHATGQSELCTRSAVMQFGMCALLKITVLVFHINEVTTRPIGIGTLTRCVLDVCACLCTGKLIFAIYRQPLRRNLRSVGCEDYAAFRCFGSVLFLFVLCNVFIGTGCKQCCHHEQQTRPYQSFYFHLVSFLIITIVTMS